MGKIANLEESLKKVSTWKGPIKSVFITGNSLQVFVKPNFEGEAKYLPSFLGTVAYQGGPSNEQEAKTYKQKDVTSFIVPRGIQLIVITGTGPIKTTQRYLAGKYPNTVIPDVKEVQIALVSDRY
jgi:hypothetical protein